MSEDERKSPVSSGQVSVEPGKPLKFTVDPGKVPTGSPTLLDRNIGKTLGAYLKAARSLLDGKFAGQRELAPPHMQVPCDVVVFRCNDGVLVRYDISTREKPVSMGGKLEMDLAQAAPLLSEQVIHFPEDPKNYVPPPGGVELGLAISDPKTGATVTPPRARLLIFASAKIPDGFQIPLPPSRPPCLVGVHNDFEIQLQGALVPEEPPSHGVAPVAENFLVSAPYKLPVGWQAIEIYPLLGEEHWKPEYAPLWAEMDLLAVLAQKNSKAASLKALDGRGPARKKYSGLLAQFQDLLQGPEELVHQFLKAHPELLCATYERCWSKLPFGEGPGKRVSDFVFREPHEDYLLVEIEAAHRELFRKDGQQREELTHAINQIMDWIQYIANNKSKVEMELGLTGISTNPRTLVVIGRSESLTDENRKKLATLQAQQNKLRILTYDDLILAARQNLERILGPLNLPTGGAEIYYFTAQPSRDRSD